MVAFGEGTVAGVAMATFLIALGVGIPIPLAIIIGVLTGLAGAFCNYYLVKGDTFGVAKDVVIKGFFSKLSGIKRDLAIVLGLGSLATGFVYGALSAMQIFNGLLTPIFTKIGLPHAMVTILGVGLASLPVLFTTVGIASIFFYVIADFIKNERWLEIRNYWYRNYWDLGWGEMSPAEKLNTFFIICGFRFIKLAVALTVNIAITIASFGVFHANGVKLLSHILNSSTAGAAGLFLAITSAITSFPFGVKKIASVILPIAFTSLMKGLTLLLPYYIPLLVCAVVLQSFKLLTHLLLVPHYFVALVRFVAADVVLNMMQKIVPNVLQMIKELISSPTNICIALTVALALVVAASFAASTLLASAIGIVSYIALLQWFPVFHSDSYVKFFENVHQKLRDKLLAACFNLFRTASDLNEAKSARGADFISWVRGGLVSCRSGVKSGMNFDDTRFFIWCRKRYDSMHQFDIEKTVNLGLAVHVKYKIEKKIDGVKQDKPLDSASQPLLSGQAETKRTIPEKVDDFGFQLMSFTLWTVVINALGQGCLMVSGAGLFETRFGKALGDLIAGGCEFLYSAAPNKIAVEGELPARIFSKQLPMPAPVEQVGGCSPT